MDETLVPLKPEDEADGALTLSAGRPEAVVSAEQERVLRDAAGNELRITEHEGLQGSLHANYEDLTAEATHAETIHGFRVFQTKGSRATSPRRHRSSDADVGAREAFDQGRFGEKLEVLHDESLQQGGVVITLDPEDSQKVIARTGGPKTRVQATLTPGGGINLKMRRGDKRIVRLGWTPEEAREAFGEGALAYTAETARDTRLSRVTGMYEAPGPSSDAEYAPVTAEADDEHQIGAAETETPRTSPEHTEGPNEAIPVAEDDVEAVEENPAQRERVFTRALKSVGRKLPRAAEIVFLVGVAAGLLVGDRTAGAVRRGQIEVHAGQPPNTTVVAGEFGTTTNVTIGPGDNLYNLVQAEVVEADPGLEGNKTELADDTRAIMLVTEELNTTITDWRHLHQGESVTLFNPVAVKGLLDVLDHKPGPRAPAGVQQEWRALREAFTELTDVHGTHNQFDRDAFLQDPQVRGWIRTVNDFMEEGGWVGR